jgi:hypothetical protein
MGFDRQLLSSGPWIDLLSAKSPNLGRAFGPGYGRVEIAATVVPWSSAAENSSLSPGLVCVLRIVPRGKLEYRMCGETR